MTYQVFPHSPTHTRIPLTRGELYYHQAWLHMWGQPSCGMSNQAPKGPIERQIEAYEMSIHADMVNPLPSQAITSL